MMYWDNDYKAWICTGLEYQEILRKKYGLPDDWKPSFPEPSTNGVEDSDTPTEFPHGADQPDCRPGDGQG
jgi:hypothetical protein